MLRKFPHNLRKFVCEMDLLAYSSNIQNLIEILKDHLYFAILTPGVRLKNTDDTLFFNVDNEFVYANYYFDFGPLNISCLYKYCRKVNRYLYESGFKRVVHCTTTDNFAKANAAYLIGSYAVIYFQVHPEKLAKALVSGCERFLPFNDASIYGSYYKITLLDCFWAVKKAFHFGFFNFSDFDDQNYDLYNQLQNGDINWILPNKFLAFISPSDMDLPNYHSPEFYIQYFKHYDVKAVIRLNNETYNPSAFTSVGIEHHELYFPDGTTPPKKILLDFLRISETTSGAIAIHCKAGLGRTGSLIAAYIIKHYMLHAKEAIAWIRICRPGSVIGGQQGWLESMEPYLRRQGYHYRFETYGHCDKIPKFHYGIYSKEWIIQREKLLKILRAKELENAKELQLKQNIPVQVKQHQEKSTSISIKPKNSKNILGIPRFNYQPKEHIDQGEKLVSIKARGQNISKTTAGSSMKSNEYIPKKTSTADKHYGKK